MRKFQARAGVACLLLTTCIAGTSGATSVAMAPEEMGDKPFDDARRIVERTDQDITALRGAAAAATASARSSGLGLPPTNALAGPKDETYATDGLMAPAETWRFIRVRSAWAAVHVTEATTPGHYAFQVEVSCAKDDAACAKAREVAKKWPAPEPWWSRNDEAVERQWRYIVATEACERGPVQTPMEAVLKTRVYGTVVLQVITNPCGDVRSASIIQSSRDRNLDRAARNAMLGWRISHGPTIAKLPLQVSP